MRQFFVALVFLVSGFAWAQLQPREKQGIEDTLFLGNMTLKDLEYERKVFSDPYRMPIVNLGLDTPLAAADTLMAMHSETATRSLSKLLALALDKGFGETKRMDNATTMIPPAPDLPEVLRAPVGLLVADILAASAEIRKATDTLSPEEKRRLIESLPVWAVEEPLVKFDFVKAPALGQAAILNLLAKVDLPRIRRAAVMLSESVERCIPSVSRLQVSITGSIKTRIGGMTVVISGKGNDIHADTDAALVIDLGGDDLYTGRAGCGIGYASVLLDLAGNDRYTVGDLSIGAGLLGVGLAYDFGGEDVFRGGSLTFGAGLAGVGALIKTGGNNLYESNALTQGFGQFGVGVLLDNSGRDRYDCQLFGQGAARTQGVGWLIDRSGSDIYRAGGTSLNTPLFTGVYYSFAQGFGSGYREDTGGISGGLGMLTDLGGDDFYLGETYAQAASYWFSCGSLYDSGGNDTYTGYHYVQSSSMHLCSSYLFDLAGDDAYVTKFGASHAIGHDYGVAFLLDRAGNDIYAAKDSTPGVGNANGLGIFVDSDGEDRYQGPPGRGNGARGSGSLGVFVDLNGQDLYRTGLADNQGSVSDLWGVAYDEPTAQIQSTDSPIQRPVPKPGSQPMPPDTEMNLIYRKATQWGVGSAQTEVQDNIDKLIEIGLPAFEWMLKNKLGAADRLQIRAFTVVVQALGDPARRALAIKVGSDRDDEARNALSIATDAAVKEASPFLVALIGRPPLQRAAIRAAGALQSVESVPTLLPLVASQDGIIALAAMVSLSQIGDENAYGTAESVLRTGSLPMRKAALELIVKHPTRAAMTANFFAQEDEERLVRIAIELWGRLGTVASLNEAGKRLLDPRAGVRIQALLALNGRCPQEFRAAFLSLRKDPVPTVQAVAQKADTGR